MTLTARTVSRLAVPLVPAMLLSLLAGLSAEPTSAATPNAGRPAPAAAANHATGATDGAVVTLVTGDRVILGPSADGDPTVTVEPRDGAAAHGFSVQRDDTGIHVVPSDVAGLVPRRLDPELFNVTALVEMGYDDASSDTMPLIVEQAGAATTRSPFDTTDRLESIDAVAATLDKSAAADLGDALAGVGPRDGRATAQALGGATKVWLDGQVEGAALDGYLEQVNAPAAWETGLDGAGVTVAVLDTGVDSGHPALVGQVDAEQNFTDADSTGDVNGHGTHVASLLAGTGAGSDGARQGIAPGVDLLSGKVLGDDSFGQESWVVAGMEWATDHGADVVNMSLGGPAGPTDDIVVQSLEALTAQTGALFVVAAGNDGFVFHDPFTIHSPGTAASALTVSAVQASDAQASFSSEGPTRGSYRLKPDLSAPGVDILGARVGAREGDLYTPMSGTSMATPVVAGAAALLAEQHPTWTGQQVKARLVTTADPNAWYSAWTNGSGRLDLAAATEQQLSSDTANLDFGYLTHPDDAVKTRTVELTNSGTDPVTVDVHDTMSSEASEVAPADAVTADPATLTVPAGGSATTTVAFHPERLEDTMWQGVVSVDAGDTTLLRMPIGGFDEPERYDLDVSVLDRHGNPWDPSTGQDLPNADPSVFAFNADDGHSYRLFPDAEGHASARVSPGHYSIQARVVTPAGNGDPRTMTITGTSEVVIDSDRSYVLDARNGRRLQAPTVAGQQTRATIAAGVTYRRRAVNRTGYTEGASFTARQIRTGRVFVTPLGPVTTGTFEATMRWRLEPRGQIGPQAPDAYDLLLNEPRLSESLISAHLGRDDVRDLARVEQVLHPLADTGEHVLATTSTTEGTDSGFNFVEPFTLPRYREVLTTAAPDVYWNRCLEPSVNWWRGLCTDPRPLRPGTTPLEIGAAVHPAIAETNYIGDRFFAAVGMSDGTHSAKVVAEAEKTAKLNLSTAAGEDLGTVEGGSGYFSVPETPGRYRLTHRWTLLPGGLRASSPARTVWEFGFTPGVTPPLLDVEYGPKVDLWGRATARRPMPLDLSFGRAEGATAPLRISDTQLWWSADRGTMWQVLPVRRTGAAGFAATVPGRALRSGGSLSLHVVATDADGNSIDQTSTALVPVR